MNLRLHLRNLSPDAGNGGGGDGGGNDGGGGSGNGGGGSGASGGGDFVPRADFDKLSQSYSGLSSKFEGMHKDYESRFAPRSSEGEAALTREPKLEDYEGNQAGVTKYIKDLTKYNTKQNWDEHQTASQKAQAAQAGKAKRQSSLDGHVKRMSEAMTRYKDFDSVVNNAPGLLPDGTNGQPDVLADVLESEHSADLQYHLSKNPGDYWRLLNAYNQSERQGARFLGALEARFANDAQVRKQNLRQARGSAMADAGGEFEGGGENDDSRFDKLAKESFGIGRRKKE